MLYPVELQYSKSHEWVKVEDGVTVVGISDFAQNALGDVVFVNLPAEGDGVTAGEAFGDVESVKAVSDLVSPVTGTVCAVNEELLDAPEKLNSDPYGAWLIKVENVDGQRGAAGRRRLRGLLRRGGLSDGQLRSLHRDAAGGNAPCRGREQHPRPVPATCRSRCSSPSRCISLPGLSELEVSRAMTAMAAENRVYGTVLRGAGAYDHYIPSIVKYIPAKEEFLTAYTPYQAEMSQGLLQSIFEYQTMICELTGMDVSNASVYDGATAAAEAAAMCRDRKRRVTLISGAAHPDTINTVRTYCYGTGDELRIVPAKRRQAPIWTPCVRC